MNERVSQREIFRHFRPHFFNQTRMALEPFKCGGLSFLIVPVEQDVYNFWVYICPEDVGFSARQAVSSLKKIHNQETAPFGTIMLNNISIIEAISQNLINGPHLLPTEAGKQMLNIMLTNNEAELKKLKLLQRITRGTKVYENG